MNSDTDPEDTDRTHRTPDALGLAGTSRDHTGGSSGDYSPETTFEITGILPAQHSPHQASHQAPHQALSRYANMDQYQMNMSYEEERDYYKTYGESGVTPEQISSQQPRNIASWGHDLGFSSDSGSIGAENAKKSKVPAWIYAIMVMFGVAVIGVAGYMLVDDYVQSTQAQEAPVPEEEDLFDANSAVTYDGPERHQIDWEAEFDNIDFQEEDNVAGVVVPSLGMYTETIATDAEEGSLVLPEAPQGTWYEQTAPVGAENGNSILSGHVNHRDSLDFSPWGLLHESERGMLIGVRDSAGDIYIYETTTMDIYSRQTLPEEYFRTDGDHQLHLVTCSGEVMEDPEALGGRYFEHNLIVSADLVEEV